MGNIVNRVFDSSGPEGKVRGTPQQIIDKYNQLARDAQLSNDRVATENFQQHAEHYLRLLAEALKEQQERQSQQQSYPNDNRQHSNDDRQHNNNNNDERQQYSNNDDRQQNNNNNNDERRNQRPQQQQANDRDDEAGRQPEPTPVNRNERNQREDVIDVEDDASESVLVETPENRAPKPRRTRKKAPVPEAGAEAAAEAVAPPDAAE